jgi:hypothetical protein
MAWVATGASVLGSAFGLYQGLQNQEKADAAKKRLDQLAKNSPIWKPDVSIHDYYQKALNRLNENVFASSAYLQNKKNAEMSTATAFNALKGRPGAKLSDVNKLVELQNNANANAVARADADKNARLSQVGNAAQALNNQGYKEFDVNKMAPYRTQVGLTGQELASENQQAQAGYQGALAGLSNIAAIGAKGEYGKWFKG